MGADIRKDSDHIFRDHIVSALHHGDTPAHTAQCQSSSGADPQGEIVAFSRGDHQPGDVIDDLIAEYDPGCDILKYQQAVQGNDLANAVDGISKLMTPEDGLLRLMIRISHGGTDQEAVQLCMRQQLSSCGSHLVLCCDHQERLGQWITVPVHCHLLLFHRFQKRRLCFTGCSVDLIRQQEVRLIYDAGLVYEPAGLLVIQ